jgi:exosortase E/protease (VPEID-CTERM system)
LTTAARSSPSSPLIPRSAWIHWGGPIGLLLLEYLTVSLTFDIGPLAERADWLAALGGLGALGPLALAVATATFLLGGDVLRSELREALASAAVSPREGAARPWMLLSLHGIAFGGFLALTQSLVGSGAEAPPRLLALAWAGSGLAVPLTLVHAVLPISSLMPLARRTGYALTIGAGVGLFAWGAGVWAERLWPPLAGATLALAGGLLRAAGAEVTADPATATLGVNGFEAVISPVCSGYQGIGLILILTGAYLWTFRHELRFPIVLALVPLAVLLIWLANGVRIAALMAVGASGSPELALGGFHSKAGWILFCGIALGLVALTRRSPIFHRGAREERAAGAPTWNPSASYLMPLLALVAAGMLTNLLSSGFEHLYPVGAFAAVAALWIYRHDRVKVVPLAWSWNACGLGVVTFVLWVALEPPPDARALASFEHGLHALSPVAAAFWLLCRLVGSVAVVPVVEELAFRGYLLRRLVCRDFSSVPFRRFTWLSFLASSLAFGALHQSWLAGCLSGMLFAFAQYRRGRLGDAILAHAVANLLIACYALGWERWSLWL